MPAFVRRDPFHIFLPVDRVRHAKPRLRRDPAFKQGAHDQRFIGIIRFQNGPVAVRAVYYLRAARFFFVKNIVSRLRKVCLLYTSKAADE